MDGRRPPGVRGKGEGAAGQVSRSECVCVCVCKLGFLPPKSRGWGGGGVGGWGGGGRGGVGCNPFQAPEGALLILVPKSQAGWQGDSFGPHVPEACKSPRVHGCLSGGSGQVSRRRVLNPQDGQMICLVSVAGIFRQAKQIQKQPVTKEIRISS